MGEHQDSVPGRDDKCVQHRESVESGRQSELEIVQKHSDGRSDAPVAAWATIELLGLRPARRLEVALALPPPSGWRPELLHFWTRVDGETREWNLSAGRASNGYIGLR